MESKEIRETPDPLDLKEMMDHVDLKVTLVLTEKPVQREIPDQEEKLVQKEIME